MDKNYWMAFCIGGLTSLCVLNVVDFIISRPSRKESDKLAKKAYKTIRNEVNKDPEFAELLKKDNPKLYEKVMESK